ncbi:hypothetical protein EVAR_71988_1 [Eumeta japonica]|uniref:(+)RNA virus helicase C-terminal domain-containing protein n=1 Tax=Eumeta variegata TaxID=151549 RepID=A0A4C1THP7_EUMVA|nr:hypothetical protein EVAR_71988_1 [Eumeta japonica]
MVKTFTKRKASCEARKDWVVSDITWVNGIPGCDKTTWVVKHFESGTALHLRELYKMDVACAISNKVYSGIYSSMTLIWSLGLKRYSDTNIPNTLHIIYTQVEKEFLIDSPGIWKRRRDKCPDYPQSTGLTSERTVIVWIASKHKLHESVSHAVVAITRHTVSCVYRTDNGEDAIGRFIKRAVTASENKIKDHQRTKNGHLK